MTNTYELTRGDSVDVSIKAEEIVSFLKKNIQLKDIYQKIIYQRIIAKAASERNVVVTPEEIQAEADKQRRDNRLEKAADAIGWLKDNMIDAEDWEGGIVANLLEKKLAENLFAKDVEKVFAENRLNFEQLVFYQIVVPYEKLAWEIFYQIEEEEMSFYQAAHLYDVDEKRRRQCGFEGKIYRWGLKPDLATAVFASTPGSVIPPVQTEQGYHLMMIEEVIAAQLNEENRQQILNQMFGEWLAGEFNYVLHNST